ncbi:MAG: hypothetical protein Ct9H300mP22_2140 [Gammaproteobacteria bacterium]|nr:MAG: hypothetical protein Ct9H300mP22_2140 [Gammaproteobacteria bacterium]
MEKIGKRKEVSVSLNKLEKKEQRQLAAAKRAELAPLYDKVKKFENEMDRIQKELTQIENELSDEALYKEEKNIKLTETLRRPGKMKAYLETIEVDWFSAQQGNLKNLIRFKFFYSNKNIATVVGFIFKNESVFFPPFPVINFFL